MSDEQAEIPKYLTQSKDLLSLYMTHLSKTVKRDETTKKIVFLTALSAYSENPLNLFLRGPSSIGKTYNVARARALTLSSRTCCYAINQYYLIRKKIKKLDVTSSIRL